MLKSSLNNKIRKILIDKKVMTIGSCQDGMPWSSPVYFVWYDHFFAFFSNADSRHIRYTLKKTASASIFNDGDRISDIYGLQMTGKIKKIKSTASLVRGISRYVQKFNFLENEFGKHIFEDPDYLLRKFNASFYAFLPETVFFSDSVTARDKNIPIDVDLLKTAAY